MVAFCHSHSSVGLSAGSSQPWIVPPIPLPGQKWPAWPTRSLDALLRKSLEASEATAVEFIGLKRVAKRLLPKSHGPRFRHRRDAVRGSLRQNDDASPSKQPEGNLGECDQAMCASGASRAAKGLYVGALASKKRGPLTLTFVLVPQFPF